MASDTPARTAERLAKMNELDVAEGLADTRPFEGAPTSNEVRAMVEAAQEGMAILREGFDKSPSDCTCRLCTVVRRWFGVPVPEQERIEAVTDDEWNRWEQRTAARTVESPTPAKPRCERCSGKGMVWRGDARVECNECGGSGVATPAEHWTFCEIHRCNPCDCTLAESPTPAQPRPPGPYDETPERWARLTGAAVPPAPQEAVPEPGEQP